MNEILAWARRVKPDLVRMQEETGIPAWWAAAQFCHESYAPGKPGELSDLARLHCNYAGLKFANWQRDFACTAVTMGTWEEIDGNAVDLGDAFCSCQNNGGWQTWLKVYASLLTGSYYGSCLTQAADPLAYGRCIASKGYATDSRYIQGAAEWLERLRPDYADTLKPATPAPTPAPTPTPPPNPVTWPPGLIAEIYTTTPDFGLEPLRFCGSWRRSWTQILPARIGPKGAAGLVFYDPVGDCEVYTVDGQGRLTFVQSATGAYADCGHAAAGHFTGSDQLDVILYNEGAGDLEFWSTTGDSQMECATTYPDDYTWTALVPIRLPGSNRDILLRYDPAKGQGEFMQIDGNDRTAIKKHKDWRSSWSIIRAGSFGGSDGGDLLFYDAASGDIEFYKVDAQGGIDYLGGQAGWHPNLTQIVPGRFGGTGPTDLLGYDASTGTGCFYSATAPGKLTLRTKSTGWRASWKQIVPINIGNSGRTALLFYDPAGTEGGEAP